ncbi:dTDP-4-dehydrorhamnose 3,5-epimerase family protein [Streptomyces sp. RPT161]|uniref:dTDP-4-dehydrorhamnose 3,5-epimerase family protein n=1 Tax=Streptomyces sp. RPT161 TaxID=3015993 RepID=UPI0022B91B67|nr:dTDP-4-dehydrorhamnose 3,5-epimerase [Streptomyces sp. RPT161]
MRPLGIEGAWLLDTDVFADDRGSFHQWFQGGDFRAATGHELRVAQANCSVSRRGALRGIHFADVPPGQGKQVTCLHGAVFDVVVDLRVGSPTFRRWEAVRLDDQHRRAVYLAEGLGHAFLALTDDTVVAYLTSQGYAPQREHAIHPLDPALGIDWPGDVEPVLSPRDAAAPTLAEAERRGLLPSYRACREFYADLRAAASEQVG